MKHLTLAFLICLVGTASKAQSVELNLLYSKKAEAVTKGDFQNALVYGEKAVAKAKEEFGDTEVYANYAGDLAQLYFQLKKYPEARILYENVLKIYQQKLGPFHVYTAVTNNNLGNLYRLAGEKSLALKAYQNGLEGYRQSLTSKHEYYAMTLNTLIDFCKEAELNDELVKIYKQERINTSSPSSDNPEYIAWTNNLAMLLEELGNYAEAEPLYKESIDLAQKNKTEYAGELPTLNANLGHFYLTQNRLDEAEKYMLRSIVASHESYPTHLSNLGMVYERSKKFDKALESYLKALSHLSESGQDTSATFRMIAYNATESLNRAGRYNEEIKLIKKALAKSRFDARLINELGIAYTNAGAYAKADSAFNVVLVKKSDSKIVSSQEHLRATAGRADVWRIQGKLKEAETLLLGAIKNSQQDSVVNEKALITLRHNLAYLYKTMGEYPKAELIARKALKKYETNHGRDAEFAGMLKNYGSLHMDLIQYEKAERFIKEAMVIERKELGEQSDAYSTSLNQLGLVYFYQGRYNESKACTQRSLEIKEIVLGKQHEYYANGLVNMANVLMAEGLFEQAEPLYRQGERIYRNSTGPKTKNYANILHSLGKVKMSIGFYGEAKKLFDQTLVVSEEVVGINHPDYANALNSLGMLYREIDQYEKADSAYTVSLALRKAAGGDKSYSYAQSLNNLADLYVFTGRQREAAKMYEQGLIIAQNTVGKTHPDYATYLNNLGQAHFKDGNFEKAQQCLQSAIDLREKIYGKANLLTLEAKSNLLATLDAIGKYKDAEKIYEFLNDQYLDFIFKKFPHLTENEKTAFYSTVQYHFEAFQSFALRRRVENPAILGQMFDIQLATKALLLNSSKKVKDLVLQSTDIKLKTLYNDWLGKREYLAKAYSLPESEIIARGIKINALESTADSLERSLGLYSPIFSDAYSQNKTSWKDVKKNLKAGEAAIEMCRFYLFEQAWIDSVNYAALILRSDSNVPEVVTFANGKQMETRLLKYYKGTIRAKISESKSWENYWSPIEKKLSGVRKLYFSPDGVYNEINLNTLTDSSGVAVLDKFSIQMITTSKEIIPVKTRAGSSRRMLLVGRPSYTLKATGAENQDRGDGSLSRTSRWLGDASFADLPGTQREVEEIATVLKKSGPVETYLGDQAREEIVKNSTGAKILHIATHGFFIGEQTDEFESYKKHEDNFSNPMLRSGIVMAGVENFKSGGSQNAEDGILTAMEVCNLRLENTDLVVMSACETGLGEVRYGEGVYGLQRAFRIAGAKAMIMSLWKVDDQATQEMMVLFYRYWMINGNMRQAFDRAQKEIRDKYKFPFYWGAFVLLGA
jgi:tetratricopeptide (TPR) repeat protein/CHAT domain-containing protein